jgi:lipopolysaccharide/colanic/teichoic acid biosynthesis glycosyltransferase
MSIAMPIPASNSLSSSGSALGAQSANSALQPQVTRLWGLTPMELHDAYWRCHGIQCVRRGDGRDHGGGADAYLLLEPEQLVLFDLREISQALQWTRAELCRVRVDEAGEEAYRERVRIGEDGLVKRIERMYAREYRLGHSVLLTDRAHLAIAWSNAQTRRDGWKSLRRGGRAVPTDAFRVHGWSFRAGSAEDETQLLNRLVDLWSEPERSIEGIELLGEGIYGLKGTSIPTGDILVGPLWLGGGFEDSHNPREGRGDGRLLVGPAWERDRTPVSAARLLAIDEILSPERVAEAERTRSSEHTAYHLIKRLIDIATSASVLLMILPIIVVVSIAVVLDDGLPIFFGHRRQTKGGRVFRCWKFRTMRRNAEALAKELRSLNVCDGPQFFIKDDPRVTRVGKLLRAWHLDELPQFWNVLVGDMSMVGPRPSPDGENQFCPAWRELRLSVRPGITGLWQVERTREPGRDFQEWIRFDIEYVNRASLWLDLWICFKTLANIIQRRGPAAETGGSRSDAVLASSKADSRPDLKSQVSRGGRSDGNDAGTGSVGNTSFGTTGDDNRPARD